MKYCPNCQTKYADDTLKFCLQDGTRLENGLSEPPTVAFGETETVLSPRANEKIRFDIHNSDAVNSPPHQITNVSQTPNETKKSNTALTILLTVFGMILLFGIIGVGAWLYLKNNQTEIVKDTNNSPNTANQISDNELNKNSEPKKTPTPKTPVNAAVSNISSNKAATPPPEIDREQIKSDVSQSLNNWKSKSESLDLDDYMNSYADTVNYYKKSGASRSFVRNDKQRAFTKFDSMRVNLTNVSVSPDVSGERATVVFDKEWQFSGAESDSSGKVRQQISFKKINGKWLITGEKDLKVYYIE